MRITAIETLQADAGYRTASYIKLSTDEGLVGWAEYYDGFAGVPVTPLIHGFARSAVGMDPRQYMRVSETLHATTRLATGGLSFQAIAAIENACLDVAAKAQGVPVYMLFGGPFRDSVPVYWTHCGSYRVAHAAFFDDVLGTPPIRTLDDLKALAGEAVARGFTAVKTNPVFFDRERPRFFNGGFRIAPGFMDRNYEQWQVDAVADQMAAFREGLGPGAGLMLDLNFSQRTEGYIRIARRLEPYDLYWLEVDIRDPEALATIRASTRIPIASLESLHGVREYRPYIARQACDVALIDPLWNGVAQSVRIALYADAHETMIAPHNPVGELGNLMSAHFCAAVPNVRIMEMRVDEAPWSRDFVTRTPALAGGRLQIPDAPGWGADVNEDAVRARPPRAAR